MKNTSWFNKEILDLDKCMRAGKEYVEEKRYDEAKERFKKIIEIDPDNREAHFELGKIYYIQNENLKALNELKKLDSLFSKGAHHHLLLVKVYKELKNLDLALEEIKYALRDPLCSVEANNELKDIYPEYIDQIKSYSFRGDYEKTHDRAEKIYSLVPEDDIFYRNKLLSELELSQKKVILNSKMRNLIITLSTRCNLNCTMCEEIKTHWEIPKKTLQEIVSFFPYLERIVWQGGEVFLLDYFGELIESAGKFKNLRQVITTNGLLIDERWAERLVKSNVDLTFSIDGATKDVYERIRKGARFEDVIRNLRNFNDLKKQYAPWLNINLHVVVMKSNYHQLESFIDFAKEYDFKLLALLPIGGNHDNPENIFHFKDTKALGFIEKAIPKIIKKSEEYGILLENRLGVGGACDFNSGPLSNKMLCHLPWIQLYVDYDGSIRPDCVCKPEERLGNVSKDSLADVWNNQKMQAYRRKIIEGRSNEICNYECTEGRVSERYLKFS